MFVWEKNVPIVVFSLSRRPINTVCTIRRETSLADIQRLPCLWLQNKHNCWSFVVRKEMLNERVLGLNLKVLQHCSNENFLHNPKNNVTVLCKHIHCSRSYINLRRLYISKRKVTILGKCIKWIKKRCVMTYILWQSFNMYKGKIWRQALAIILIDGCSDKSSNDQNRHMHYNHCEIIKLLRPFCSNFNLQMLIILLK